MSAFADDEDSFLRFARRADPDVTGGTFVPRRLYGEYLEFLLHDAEANAAPNTTLSRVVGEARTVEPSADGTTVDVTTADGWAYRADKAVIALGNFPPVDPPIDDPAFFRSKRYTRDPWAPRAFDAIKPGDRVLMIGTGLTMLDIALEMF